MAATFEKGYAFARLDNTYARLDNRLEICSSTAH